MVSSASGEVMNYPEMGFVWGPRVAAGLKPRVRLVKKTMFSKVCLRKFFCHATFEAAPLSLA